MKRVVSTLLFCVATAVLGDAVKVKRQSSVSSAAVAASSSTSSVFSVPTPTTLPTVNSSQYDLSQHFCRIWRHQSVYADGKIYIDGGNTYVPDNGGTFNTTPPGKYEQGMNDGLLVLDLSQNFTNQDSFPYSTIDKGPQVPNTLIEGVLWYSSATRKIYQVGGWFSFNSQANPGFVPLANIPESSIWEFDIDRKTWAQSSFTLVNTGRKVDRPGASASCNAPTLNMSFIFEGYVQQRSDHDYINYTQSSTFKFEEGILQLDTNTSPPTLTNISVPTYVGPRMNGAMIHVPVGAKGVLVQIGGQTTMDPTPFGVPIINANAMNTNINMSFVDIYDIETGYWFRQDTFGVPDLPTGRSDICTILVSAQDGSSHNIFVIAGVETYNSVIDYEDMWVLTLPTFQWKKVHTRDGGRYGHTCHVVGENLIIVGGMETTSTGGNVNNCSTHMPAEMFSLVSMDYTGIFDVGGASRLAPVPTDIVSLIGGTPTGGAVVRAPKEWSDLYLQYIFDPTLTRPAYTPTYQLANATAAPANSTANSTASATPNPQSSSSTNVGAIAGGVVGGVVFLIILAVIVGCCLRRRKIARAEQAAGYGRASELPTYDESKSPAAVEIAQHGGGDMGFTPHQHIVQDPAELQGEDYGHQLHENEQNDMYGEGHDQLRPLSTPQLGTPPISPPLSAPQMGYGRGAGRSPQMSVGSMNSQLAGDEMSAGRGSGHSPQLSVGSIHSQTTEDAPVSPPVRKPVIQRKSVASGESGRLSRQSEVSGLS